MKFIKTFKVTSIFYLIVVMLTISCNNSDDPNEMGDPNNQETVDLTKLPFGGPNVLIRNQGDAQPDFLSLWLCGLPSDGAGNSDASDWTNAEDGTWG